MPASLVFASFPFTYTNYLERSNSSHSCELCERRKCQERRKLVSLPSLDVVQRLEKDVSGCFLVINFSPFSGVFAFPFSQLLPEGEVGQERGHEELRTELNK